LEKYSESSSSVAERDALRKMVLRRWSVGAVGAGSVRGGAVGGARFGVLRAYFIVLCIQLNARITQLAASSLFHMDVY
jgi:hypothetical protein